jgi:hypothetical protein
VESHDFRRLLNVDATTLSRRTMTLSNAVIAQWGGIKPRPVNGSGALLAAKTSVLRKSYLIYLGIRRQRFKHVPGTCRRYRNAELW